MFLGVSQEARTNVPRKFIVWNHHYWPRTQQWAPSTSWRHFERSCARIHAVLGPTLWVRSVWHAATKFCLIIKLDNRKIFEGSCSRPWTEIFVTRKLARNLFRLLSRMRWKPKCNGRRAGLGLGMEVAQWGPDESSGGDQGRIPPETVGIV